MNPNPVAAHRNKSFLDGDDGRPPRILAEYLRPLQNPIDASSSGGHLRAPGSAED